MKDRIKVGAIIVSFNPNILNLKNLTLQLLKYSNLNVYVIDNASAKSFNLEINNSAFRQVTLTDNLGIAKAQNEGIDLAIKDNVDYILFFDQDSSIPDYYLDNLLSDYHLLLESGVKVGAIGPRFIDERFNFYYKTVNMSRHGFREKLDTSSITQPLHSSLLISSGSLISVNTLKEVGYMKESYFIDYVDTEWCIRAEYLGYQNYVSSKAVMRHTIGDNVLKFKFFNVPVHSPFRRYYRVRNAFYMAKEKHVPFLLISREMLFNFIHQIILIIFEKQKMNYFKSYFKAIRDGFLYWIK
ncbi:rhamnosyltransferase [Acinetobacter soli]